MPARIVLSKVWADAATRSRKPYVWTLTDPARPVWDSPDGPEPPTFAGAFVISPGPPSIVAGQPVSDAEWQTAHAAPEHAWCLGVVTGSDLSPLDADPNVKTLFEIEDEVPAQFIRARLTKTPRELGWTGAKAQRVKAKIESWGFDLTGVGMDTPLWQIAQRIAQTINPQGDVRRLAPLFVHDDGRP